VERNLGNEHQGLKANITSLITRIDTLQEAINSLNRNVEETSSREKTGEIGIWVSTAVVVLLLVIIILIQLGVIPTRKKED